MKQEPMEMEELLKKWLADELSEEETASFLKLEEGNLTSDIILEAKRFKAGNQTSTEDLEKLSERLLNTKKTKAINFPWLKIAAVMVLCIGLAYFLMTKDEISNKTIAGETKTVELPDTSEVLLNAVSVLRYDDDSWKDARNVSLDGEAYFKVAKGEKFTVSTNNGIVSVVGTQYNVKSRGSIFVVSCYEGSVKVQSNKQEILLLANEEANLVDGVLKSRVIEATEPSWVNEYAQFENETFIHVLQELERQYGIKISYTDKIASRKFTGRFDFNNLELALKEITSPMNLSFSIRSQNDVIIYE